MRGTARTAAAQHEPDPRTTPRVVVVTLGGRPAAAAAGVSVAVGVVDGRADGSWRGASMLRRRRGTPAAVGDGDRARVPDAHLPSDYEPPAFRVHPIPGLPGGPER